MKVIHASILLALALSGASCYSDNFKSASSRTSSDPAPLQADASEEPQSTRQDVSESDAVALPIPVTGAYLFCQELNVEGEAFKRQIGCRVESSGEVIADFAEQVDDIQWAQQSQGSSVQLKSSELAPGSYWQKLIEIEAAPTSILSSLEIALSFRYQQEAYSIKTQLTIVWDADCALPPIDFEALAGQNFSPGLAINDQYSDTHGVRFSTLSGAPVLLAAYGSADPVAYYGGANNSPNFLAEHQNAGRFFITDGHKQADVTDTLVITYDRPSRAAAVDLVDIDFSETYVVRAFDGDDQIIDVVEIASPIENYRDGQMSRFILRASDPNTPIQKLHISGSIPAGLSGIGFGVDNFAPRCDR